MSGRRRWPLVIGACLVLAACGDSPEAPHETETMPSPPEFTIRYVQRLPVMEFVPDAVDPTREGWPAPGERVTWSAHVHNRSDRTWDVPYEWRLDDALVGSGVLSLPADSEAVADFPWDWTFDRHRLTFVLDPHDEIEEAVEANNEVELFTDALSIGFYVEESYHRFYRHNIGEVDPDLNSFEDWAHEHVRTLNHLFRNAVDEETPDGVLDRVRLDRVTVVPNGSLETTQYGDRDDRTVDMQWAFLAEHVEWLHGSDGYSPAFGFNATLLHELGHARGLIDVYRWDLGHEYLDARIDIDEGGEPIVGSPYMPVLADILNGGVVVHETSELGLMNREYAFMDRYSAIALNRMAGERPTIANYNCAAHCGAFMDDLPEHNVLRLVDRDSVPLADAAVDIYTSTDTVIRDTAWFYVFDDVPDAALVSDADGKVEVGRNPFGTMRWGQDRIHPRRHVIVRVEDDAGRVGYGILESRPFNLAYWRGETDRAEHTVVVSMVEP